MKVAAGSTADGAFAFGCAVVPFGHGSLADLLASAPTVSLSTREHEYGAGSLPGLDRLAGRLAARAAVLALQRETDDARAFEVRADAQGIASVVMDDIAPMLSISHDGSIAIAIAVQRR